jgi:hypothetical protein
MHRLAEILLRSGLVGEGSCGFSRRTAKVCALKFVTTSSCDDFPIRYRGMCLALHSDVVLDSSIEPAEGCIDNPVIKER